MRKKTLRRIFDPKNKNENETGDWRKMSNMDLCNLFNGSRYIRFRTKRRRNTTEQCLSISIEEILE